jgi:ATP citrate (pro-S)-lyase
MSAKSILEADGKAILNYHLTRAPVIKPSPLPSSGTHNAPPKLASLYFPAGESVTGVLDAAEAKYPFLLVPGSKFVAKPDQLIKRRGKSGLLCLNKSWAESRAWIEARAGKEQRVETVDGVLRQFLVEPFVPHPDGTEYYININSVREVCQKVPVTCFIHESVEERLPLSDLLSRTLQQDLYRRNYVKSKDKTGDALSF